MFAEAERLRGEWVIRVSGSVRPRPEGTANPNLKSGAVELLAREIEVLNRSEALPFQLDEDVQARKSASSTATSTCVAT